MAEQKNQPATFRTLDRRFWRSQEPIRSAASGRVYVRIPVSRCSQPNLTFDFGFSARAQRELDACGLVGEPTGPQAEFSPWRCDERRFELSRRGLTRKTCT